jgi:O-antigen ligase/polysaccharide polymerase Wzy-like membrane protein
MVELAGHRLRTSNVRAALHRSFTSSHLPLGLTAGVVVGSLAFANGGYFPVSWGWSGLALLWLAAVALALGVAVELDVLDRVFLGALAGLTVWVALSLLWTSSVPETILEVERMLVYLSAGIAGVLLLRRTSMPTLLVGVWAAITVVSGYAVASRLFPDRVGVFDPISTYRLSDPVGYWNAFGILAAMATLLALGFAARSGPLVRCLAAGSVVLLMLTLYFTYSRGAWIAFFVGLAAAVAIDRRRLQLITTALVLAPWPMLAIWVASTSPALTHQGAALSAASRDGHGLAVIAIALAVGAALAILVLDWLEATVSVPHALERFYAGMLIFVLAASLIVVFGRYGLPPTLARKAYNAFNASPKGDGKDLNSRLFSLSGNGRTEHFHTVWQQARGNPALGDGAGSYAGYWFQHRRVAATVHDAHSLYLETLGELGVPGLLLLALVFGAPLAAVRRARSSPLAAVTCAAFLAYLVHAAIDWDWEMPAVTLAALFCGLALLAAAHRDGNQTVLRPRVRWTALGGTAALVGLVLLGLLGNSAVSASSKSTEAGHLARAESQARRAMNFAPWSAEPWRRLAEAQVVAGNGAAARESFRKAITKDRRDWTLWFELGTASSGVERQRALNEASRLNPLSPEIAAARTEAQVTP